MDEAALSAIAIGIGCRSGIGADAVASLVRDTLASAALQIRGARLFSVDAKAAEAGLSEAATQLGAPLTFLSQETLAAIATPTQSVHSFARFGIGSVAEAAALAGAGPGAALIVPRVSRDGVTCAIARGAR